MICAKIYSNFLQLYTSHDKFNKKFINVVLYSLQGDTHNNYTVNNRIWIKV